MSDDGYYDDRSYIYSYLDYRPDLPPHYADPLPLPDRDPDRRVGRRGRDGGGKAGRDGDESPKGLVGAKAVFASILFTALATLVLDPGLLVYTLPIATLFVTMLALAGKGRKKREPRRLRPWLDE